MILARHRLEADGQPPGTGEIVTMPGRVMQPREGGESATVPTPFEGEIPEPRPTADRSAVVDLHNADTRIIQRTDADPNRRGR
jgi:hypothetical protein